MRVNKNPNLIIKEALEKAFSKKGVGFPKKKPIKYTPLTNFKIEVDRNVKCGVYRVKCLVNGKCYIGSSKNIEQRWIYHKLNLIKNKHSNKSLQDDYNKYGSKMFEFKVITTFNETTTSEVLLAMEQVYIDKYKNKYNVLKYSDDHLRPRRKRTFI